MARLDIIINADDLGMSREVNEATFDLLSKGRISSATIMANGPAVGDAVRAASRFARCSFGVHLNLTQFEPLTRGPGARLLVDDRAQMSRAIEKACPSPARLQAVYEELCAQVERVASSGLRISHADSHHHVHTRPFLFPVLKALQRRYRIRAIRLAKNFYASDDPCPTDLWWKKRVFNWALKSLYRTTTTAAFSEFLTYCHAEPARQQSVGSIELMVHPGAVSAAEETPILDSDWIDRRALSARLISYEHLSSARPIAAGTRRLTWEPRP